MVWLSRRLVFAGTSIFLPTPVHPHPHQERVEGCWRVWIPRQGPSWVCSVGCTTRGLGTFVFVTPPLQEVCSLGQIKG